MPKRRRTSVDCVIGFRPSISIGPLVGVSSVVNILIVVVLPAPFGPRNAKISPAFTAKDTSRTAVMSPNVFTSRSTRMMGAIRCDLTLAAIMPITVPLQRASDRTPRSALAYPKHIALWVAFAVAYVIAAKIGFRAAFVAEQVSPVWPPAGLALWAMVRFGAAGWPAVWAGAFAANMLTHASLLPAGAIATGNTLEALIGAELLRRVGGVDRSLIGLRQVVTLILGAAALSTAASATIGVSSLSIAGLQPWTRFGSLWWTWWLGDATGDLLIGAFLLTLP